MKVKSDCQTGCEGSEVCVEDSIESIELTIWGQLFQQKVSKKSKNGLGGAYWVSDSMLWFLADFHMHSSSSSPSSVSCIYKLLARLNVSVIQSNMSN